MLDAGDPPASWDLMRMHLRSVAPLVAGLAIAAASWGCVFLDPPGADLGTATTTYGTGRATMTIDGEPIVLDQLAASSQYLAGFGPEVYWFNDDGWGLRLSGGGMGPFSPASVSIDRVRTTYWSALDYGNACRVTVAQADEKGIKGTATCTGLRWTDMLRGGLGSLGSLGYVEGEDAFDATIEFTASPKTPAT
jgi:hypothetical protein